MQRTAGYPRKRAQTRRRLVRAGMIVLARTGPAGATVGEIAAEAGVASGTFYNHFPSLAALVEATSDELATGVEIGMGQLDAVEHDAPARVAIAMLQLLAVAEDDPVFAAAFLSIINSIPPFRARVRRLIRRAVADGVAEGRFDVEPDGAAVDAVLGTALQSMRSRLLGDADRSAAPDVVRLVLRLLGVPGDQIEPVVARSATVFQRLGTEDTAVA